MTWEALIPVGALVIGFFLSEIAGLLKGRRKEKNAIGKALAILLDIRAHAFYDAKLLPDAIMEMAQIPADQRGAIREKVRNLFPGSEDQKKQYREAVSLLSGSLPLLGYDLTDHELIPEVFERLKTFAHENPTYASSVNRLTDLLYKDTRRDFDKLIRIVAKAHGSATLKETNLELLDKRD